MASSFYIAEGDAFRSTDLTRGPWSPDLQHAGPPAALMAREVERALPAGFAVARMTVELHKPVPVTTLSVRTQVLRAGKKVQWFTAELSSVEGGVLARATALAIRNADIPLPAHGDPVDDPLPSPDDSKPFEFDFFASEVGYHTAMELRLARGKFGTGKVAAWMRMRSPLVAGEAPSPLQRVMTAADSGNGVSMSLDPRKHTFVNPDLTVYLHRPPGGEWVCLDARTIPQQRGIGLADTRLLDEQGPIGRSVQSLVIDAR